jgi:ribosomal protein S27E
MELIEEIPTTKQVVKRYCDDCGKEIYRDLACTRAECEFCGKHLCNKCIAFERDTSGDYREVYCRSCSNIYNKYKSNLAKAYEIYAKIRDDMYSECKKARKHKEDRK